MGVALGLAALAHDAKGRGGGGGAALESWGFRV